jgi:hypothetical protein
VDQDERLGTPQLFAGWAGEDAAAWERAVGTSVTHLSRGNGTVTLIAQEASGVAVHVRYSGTGAVRAHALWEFRTEVTRMTLPAGLTRADLLPAARARRIRQERDRKAKQEARLLAIAHGRTVR